MSTQQTSDQGNRDVVHVIRKLLDAVVDAVAAVAPAGAPGGVIYAALMTHGCTLEKFEAIMGALVRAGRLIKRGELYFVKKA